MKLTLTYDGPLASNGRSALKHELRRAFHPQLKQAWQHHPLVDYVKYIEKPQSGDQDSSTGGNLRTVGSHDFAVVVGGWLSLYAELDLLLLVPEGSGSPLTERGDIDNRLKTLFDALRCPNDPQEIPPRWQPNEDELPLHCLLEDDRLIQRINVETDRQLDPRLPASHVRLILRVTVKASRATWGNLGLSG
ncbi:hypothetical protein ACH5AL_19555 [Actinacidiphila glaucinigra]|uniref:hypothetical protein n=1 Tax=Actinacidiphila glaucinigra TaxID=235986 RepID=UPI0037B9434E